MLRPQDMDTIFNWVERYSHHRTHTHNRTRVMPDRSACATLTICSPTQWQHQPGAHQCIGPAAITLQFTVPLHRGRGPHRRDPRTPRLLPSRVLLSHWAYVVRVCVGPGLQVKGAKRYAEYIANSKYALNLLVKCQQDNPTFAKFMKQVRSFPS